MKYYLRYGLDPYCEPTGDRVTYEGVEFIEIGPGIFRMGSTYLAEGGDWVGKICSKIGLPWGNHPKSSNEMPLHWVEFRNGFWIATTEITNALYERFEPEHERNMHSDGDASPVVEVSWHDAMAYCAWLSKKSGRQIRLPHESEWECACRAGSNSEFTTGDNTRELSEHAWFDQNAERRAHSVACKRPNRWGLYDFHGNVSEWCGDAWHKCYECSPTDGSPLADETAPLRVRRGGNFLYPAEYCRSASRGGNDPLIRTQHLGFRPAFSADE